MDREPGNDANEQASDADAEARRKRLDALGALARQQPGAALGAQPDADTVAPANPASPVGAAQTVKAEATPASPARPTIPAVVAARSTSRRGRRWLVIGAAALAIVVIAVVVLRLVLTPPARHPVSNVLKLDLAKGGIACSQAVAWSPDGSQIAIVGHTGSCPSPFDTQYTAAAVNIYNTTTGKLERVIQPDDAIEPYIPIVIPTSSGGPQGDRPTAGAVVARSGRPQRNITYPSISWSPDGNSLGLPFDVIVPVGSQQNTNLQTIATGVELLRADGTNPQVLVNTTAPNSAILWDIPAQSGVPLSAQTGIGFYSDLPPAAGYHWTTGGTLATDAPFTGPTPTVPPLGPVGNPDGGASFTPWQPGSATYFNSAVVNGQPVNEQAGGYLAFADITAWSPDGKHLLAFHLTSRMQPAGVSTPSAQALHAMQIDTVPVTPVRDQGLQTALTALLGPDKPVTQLNYAWRPDGRILAARQGSSRDAPSGAVLLYDTTTGTPMATLTPDSNLLALQGNDLLAWSPNGSHLLAVDGMSGLATIWGPAALPK